MARRLDKWTLEHRLWSAFEESPLEDGVVHRAELILDDAALKTPPEQLSAWLGEIISDTSNSDFAASLVRCMGRQLLGTEEWRLRIVHQALNADNVEIRDAGAQAVESWATQEMRDILVAHSEPVRWLRGYIRDVMDDLGK